MTLLNKFTVFCDAPQPWGLYFQESASPQMEALIELHDNIMFYLVIILFGVAWIIFSIIRNYVYNKSPISNKYLNHGTLIELIWTITPALILILIAFPSFKLLYLMDEVTDPSLTVFVEGHQWYWSYQYPDFISDEDEELEFDSYLLPELDWVYFTCEHTEDGSSCGGCLSMGQHHSTIAQCIHNWNVLSYDKHLVNVPCDFSPTHNLHPVSSKVEDKVYSCARCFAVACKNCKV